MKLSDLLEEREVTLIGKKIYALTPNNDIVFTAEMSGKPWDGAFNCSGYKLTTLRGAPSSTGHFICSNNKLTSLVGAPSSVSGYFNCSDNQLMSLTGAPSSINGYFNCAYNELTSLHDVHKIIKKMDGWFSAGNNPITSCVLGVLLIEGCKKLDINGDAIALEVRDIVNKYLPNACGFQGVLECQNELLDAGFDEYAKL